ncbi:non-syndromic hearing impairment protein 5-like [Seriola lalandi dorsalis]|uniref:non-syndromic hearing impairment protein 5-like n=1 Tax=Seriola lalandi dorsalis TaxID=1841481 RepID=UPI000C6F7B96|nr:non-syndromic hearing impairment protein 5-like [Seriola lalandi dorsalis]XP_056254636.1 gasdermin-E-like [Seriola aureovittata]
MFSKATANFVRQIDPEGSLIHVSRVNDSQKLVPMALVVKRNRLWFWQRPKYHPTDFTLSDLLLGDKTLSPGLCETEFLTYKGTFGDKLSGKLKTKAGSVSVALEGRGTTMLQSCFGKLKKEELDVIKLLRDSRSRLVDMQHVLVQQLEKRADVLAVVKERIVTTNSCSITQTKKEQCIFQGVVGLLDILGSSVKVCVKDTNNIEMDSDVSLEIPSDTVIAYSILELEIKKNGHYNICLQPGTIGGFVSDTWPSQDSLNVVDGKCNGENVPTLQNGSQEMDLSPLAELNQSTRCALFKKLQETMRDRTALSYLQCVLEKLCGDDTLDMANQDMDRLSSDIHSECSQAASPAHLNATHLLVSAMEELPDETLSLLSESRADFLEAFNTLMCRLKESSGTLSIQHLPILLQDNQAFQLAEQLLSSTNVTLKRNADSLWTETGDKAEALPLILCLSTHGLSLLCTGLK